MSDRTNQSLINLRKALSRLEEALNIDAGDSDLLVDATIQRFEFCIELCWKTLKRALMDQGIETTTPREAIQKAFQVRWIQEESLWLQMLRDRNVTSHTYEEEIANEVFERIPAYSDAMRQLVMLIERLPQ